MWLIDRIAYTNRWRSRHAAEKLLLAGGLMLVAMSLPPRVTAPCVILVAFAAATLGAGVAAGTFARLLAIPLGFMLASAPMLALSIDPAHGFAVSWSTTGTWTALDVTLRALAATACLTLLAVTTPLVDLLGVLRQLGVPKVFLEIMLLTYRMTFALAACAATGAQAQATRLGYDGFRSSCRSLGQLTAVLLQNALAQARRLECGLAARGHEGDLPVLCLQPPLSYLALGKTALLIAGVALFGTLAG